MAATLFGSWTPFFLAVAVAEVPAEQTAADESDEPEAVAYCGARSGKAKPTR
jgi:hypothetical protein